MSSYHSSFSYLGKNSAKDFGWIIAHFEPDNGETDSYLSQDQVYTESHNGAKRILYGTRWNSVANVKITVIKQDGSDFTLGECREAYKWLTGNPEASWMDLYIGDEVKYRLLCTIKDVKPQKMDARTVGLNIYCESLSPWAYSPMQKVVQSVNDEVKTFSIDNRSDDLYDFVYLKTTYENSGASENALLITNTTTNETTQVTNLSTNEIITIDGNHMITSNKPKKFFGNSFNFVFPRLKAGVNEFVVEGMGRLTFEYYYPIKMGDCSQDINIVSDSICSESGGIQVDTLPWERVANTPTTLSGYGITDAYTKSEVDSAITDIADIVKYYDEPSVLSNQYSKILANINDNCIFGCSVKLWDDLPVQAASIFINRRYSTNYNCQTILVMLSGSIYTRIVDRNDGSIYRDWETTSHDVDISEEELNSMLTEVLGE